MKNQRLSGLINHQKPEAWIAVSGNRQKIYGDENSVYLESGKEFEIEIYNPTKKSYLVKIEINGELISNAGLVIKPGQRYFLDRYIDDKKKFLFSTYDVEDNDQNRSAIEDNGKVKVEFYPEMVRNWNYQGFSISTNWPYWPDPSPFTIRPNNWENPYYYNTNYNSGLVASYGTITGSSTTTCCFSSDIDTKSIETGRVEKGSDSNQTFGSDNGYYSVLADFTSEYRLLPKSTKPVEVSEIRSYCTSCGSRMKKKTWKFCPNCGEKID
jgi:hypothetical protein